MDGLEIAAVAFLVLIIWLCTKLWFWLIVLSLSALASFFTVVACVIYFQIFAAVGFTLLTWVLYLLAASVWERIEEKGL